MSLRFLVSVKSIDRINLILSQLSCLFQENRIFRLALPLARFTPGLRLREEQRKLFKLPGEKERPAAPWFPLAGPALIVSACLVLVSKER